MSQWYYARGGKQNGPVSFSELRSLASSGLLDAQRDLVWNDGMNDWKPAGQIENLFDQGAAPQVTNPYASSTASITGFDQPVAGLDGLEEIEPGSQRLDIGRILSHSWALVMKRFGVIVLSGFVMLIITTAVSQTLAAVWPPPSPPSTTGDDLLGFMIRYMAEVQIQQWPSTVINSLISIFLTLGITRIGLNVVSGQHASVGMLFGEWRKMLRAIGGHILYYLMIWIGLLLLIIPGIYVALRFGEYRTAIVDRNMGIVESFRYSAQLTRNNMMQLFLISLLYVAIVIAGLLTCGLGLILALPLMYIMMFVTYRWLQYGPRITQVGL